MNPIIQEIINKGIKIELVFNSEKKRNEYIIGGFYKSDTVKLIERVEYDDSSLLAEARYNELTIINSFDDLVHLNNSWWLHSKDRYEGWSQPDAQWLPFLLELGLVKEEKKVIYKSTINSVKS